MQAANASPEQATQTGYMVEYRSGARELHGEGPPRFTVSVADESQLRHILTGNIYSVAAEFIRGRFDISGDLVAALRLRQERPDSAFSDWLWSLAARFSPIRMETWFQGKRRAANNIRFHYGISNQFYGEFLDARLVYSAALFGDSGWSLEQAQEAKLRSICDGLALHPGERFLDVGCGWGALLVYAVEHYKVDATGCTLSHCQHEFADSLIHARALDQFASVRELDYRDLCRHYDKIASIGMFEHVGRHHLLSYFRKIHGLPESGGLFLNSGIVRPLAISGDPQTWFLLKRVFPGRELAHLSDVIRAAEKAGFEIIRVESMREDYGRTCEEWVTRMRQNEDTGVALVGGETYRTWLLYLAASAMNFYKGQTDVFSVLMSKS